MEKTCKCDGNCACKPGKSAKKHVPQTSTMYKNDNDTTYALSYIASQIGRHFGHMFGAFTLSEEAGHLVVHTEMKRDTHIENLMREHACKQPCSGDCETACPSRQSTREIAGL